MSVGRCVLSHGQISTSHRQSNGQCQVFRSKVELNGHRVQPLLEGGQTLSWRLQAPMSAGSPGAAGYVVLIGGKGRINADLRITSCRPAALSYKLCCHWPLVMIRNSSATARSARGRCLSTHQLSYAAHKPCHNAVPCAPESAPDRSTSASK